MFGVRLLPKIAGMLVCLAAAVLPLYPAVPLVASAVSNGWAIKKFVFNDRGTVVFAGGDYQGQADGIVYSWSSEFLKLASIGYEPPGVPGSLFAGFPMGDFGDLALNQNNYVVFTASFVACSNGLELASCLNTAPRAYGLFGYSNGRLAKLVLGGDPVPGRSGYVFSLFDRIWLNDQGDFVFKGSVISPSQPSELKSGLFLYSGGQIQTIAMDGDEAPRGLKISLQSDTPLSFSDTGVAVFFVPTGINGVFRYANNTLTLILASGDPAPGGGTFQPIWEAACNSQGDVVFNASFGSQPSQQGLFLMRSDGSIVRIMAHGDPTPAGGSFSLYFEYSARGGKFTSPVHLFPALNDFGTVLFASPIKGIPAAGGLFVYDGAAIRKVVAEGDPRPDDPAQQFHFASYENGDQPIIDIPYALNNDGIAVFNPARAGLFYTLGGKIFALETVGDLTPSIEGTTYALQGFKSFLLNGNGRVAFQAPICCGTYVEGIFLARPRAAGVPNGSFEGSGAYGLPVGWTTSWSNSGKAEAFQSWGDFAAAFDGLGTLRLHVEPGGGSVFVLSDPKAAPILPDTTYLLECRMRFYFDDESDQAFLSVIQYDAAGAVVGFDEIRATQGESYWTWVPKGLLIHTTPNAAFLRYRFGLISNQEKYLDIDAVH